MNKYSANKRVSIILQFRKVWGFSGWVAPPGVPTALNLNLPQLNKSCLLILPPHLSSQTWPRLLYFLHGWKAPPSPQSRNHYWVASFPNLLPQTENQVHCLHNSRIILTATTLSRSLSPTKFPWLISQSPPVDPHLTMSQPAHLSKYKSESRSPISQTLQWSPSSTWYNCLANYLPDITRHLPHNDSH